MKKLNNKGFTLIELLAVIIILAIVVGITIPAILNTVGSARDKAMQTSAETLADWFERQYQIIQVGDTSVASANSLFITNAACGDNASLCVKSTTVTTAKELKSQIDLLKAAGVKPANYDSVTLLIDENTGRACVTVKAAKSGDYAGVKVQKMSGACSK